MPYYCDHANSILFPCGIFYLRHLRYIIELLGSQLKESSLFKESEYEDNIWIEGAPLLGES
jgi:hypothetical protein